MKCQGLELTFKSGATIFVEVEKWEFKRSAVGKTLSWETPDGAKRRLISADLDEVVAVVEVRK